MLGRTCLLFVVLLLAAPALAEDDKPGEYAGRDAKWWVGQFSKPGGRSAALAALRKIGRPALEPLGEALSSESRPTREGALLSLQQLRVDPAPILPALVKALDAAPPVTAAHILLVIKRTGKAALPHLEIIASYLEREDPAAAQRALEILPERPDIAFTSEEWGPGWAELMGARHVMVDLDRESFPISGEELRSDLREHFDWLLPAARAALSRHGEHYAGFGSEEAIASLYTRVGVERRRALPADLDNLISACRRATRPSAFCALWITRGYRCSPIRRVG